MTDTKPRLTVIDTDPGIDDAIGILLALRSPEFAVVGVTTVGGNIGIDTTTRNAGRLLAFAGHGDVPVVRGAAAPLARPGPEPLDLHGADGLGGVALTDPVRTPEARPAAEWLADVLLAHPAGAVDVLALGPLTNLAQLIAARPEAAKRIGRIVAMGGTIREPGNVGPRSEFNLATDPEAAAAVIGSGLPLWLVPLDVTRRVRADRVFIAALSRSGSSVAGTVASLIGAYFAAATARESRPLHDPCVMLAVLAPDLFGWETLRLSVDTGPGIDAGSLAVGEEGHPVRVAMRVDAPAVLSLLGRRLTDV